MKTPFIAYILSLSLIFSGTPAMALDPITKGAAERAFLNALIERVEYIHLFNQGRINGLVKCLSGEISSFECDEQVGIVRENIRIQYPRMRSLQVLFNLFQSNHIELLFGLHDAQVIREGRGHTHKTFYLSYPRSILGVSPLSFENPLHTSLGLNHIKDPEFTADELNQALTQGVGLLGGFKGHLLDVCQNKMPEILDLCSQLDLHYSEAEKGFYFTSIQVTENWRRDVKRLRNLWMVQNSVAFKDKHEELKQNYFDIIKMNPYVALVPSGNPTRQELLEAFLVIKEKAGKSLHEFIKQADKIRSERASRYEELSLFSFSPAVADVLGNPTREMGIFPNLNWEEDIAGPLGSEYFKSNLVRTGATLGLIIGATILVCWAPQSRLFRMVVHIRNLSQAFKPMCIPITSAALNVGFLMYSMDEYSNIYREVFSTIDDEHYLRELEDLTSAEKMVLFDIVMLPMGTGAIMYMIRNAKNLRLSNKTLHHLERAIKRAKLAEAS